MITMDYNKNKDTWNWNCVQVKNSLSFCQNLSKPVSIFAGKLQIVMFAIIVFIALVVNCLGEMSGRNVKW